MTTELKIKANRENSRASTGPRTRYGRARAARNALRHGLSLPVGSDPVLSEQVEALAREIAGGDANAEIQECARRVAEAEIDLRRLRQARHQLLTCVLADPDYDGRANMRMKLKSLNSLLRPGAPDIPLNAMANVWTSSLQGDDKLAVILWREAKRLQAFDRYETRALSRRKLAVQAFDTAIARVAPKKEAPSCGVGRTKPKT